MKERYLEETIDRNAQEKFGIVSQDGDKFVFARNNTGGDLGVVLELDFSNWRSFIGTATVSAPLVGKPDEEASISGIMQTIGKFQKCSEILDTKGYTGRTPTFYDEGVQKVYSLPSLPRSSLPQVLRDFKELLKDE